MTQENRIAFARALSQLVLKHATFLSAEERAYVQRAADAETVEHMHDVYSFAVVRAFSTPAIYTIYATAALASCNYSDPFAVASWAHQACRHAVKAGVPEDEVNALRALLITE